MRKMTSEEGSESIKWYDKFKPPPDDFKCEKLSPEEIKALRDEAEFIMRDEEVRYRSRSMGKKGSEEEWLKMMAAKGTYADQVAARIVIVQQSPVHNVSSLNFLISKVKASKKKECILAIRNLTELFLTELLRPGQKLKTFESQPLGGLSELCSGNALTRKLQLLHWLFEDKLKLIYKEYISALETLAHDTVDLFREKAIYALSKLLIRNPEQEEILLKNLINKIGDPVQKIIGVAVGCLCRLLDVHPNMKNVVVKEIEKLLFRTNCTAKCKFYCISFLCRLRFTESDMELAKKLILLYFAFFKACVKEGDVESRLLASLISGVHKAYYFASLVNRGENIIPNEHIQVMYKIVYVGAFNVGIQALLLLQKVDPTDRYYSALYKKMWDHRLLQTSHPTLFINLIYKSIKKDNNLIRIRAFLKRLFHLCLYSPVPLACGLLYTISQLQQFKVFKIGDLIEENLEKVELFANDGDAEEKYDDIKSEDESDCPKGRNDKSNSITSSWNHCLNIKSEDKPHFHTKYDPYQRNPAFAGGERAVFRELFMLTKHFHPTVSLYAKHITEGTPIKYDGDPLNDFTLSKFLERFAFKNPKAHIVRKASGAITKTTPRGAKGMQVNTNQYLNVAEENIPVDELFLYKYLKEKRDAGGSKMNDDEPDESDDESVTDGEFLNLLEKMTGKSNILDFEDDIRDTKRAKKINKEKKDEDDSEEDEDFSGENDSSEEDESEDIKGSDLDAGSNVDGTEKDSDEDDDEMGLSDLGSEFDGSSDDGGSIDFDDDDSFDGNISFDEDNINEVSKRKAKPNDKKKKKNAMDSTSIDIGRSNFKDKTSKQVKKPKKLIDKTKHKRSKNSTKEDSSENGMDFYSDGQSFNSNDRSKSIKKNKKSNDTSKNQNKRNRGNDFDYDNEQVENNFNKTNKKMKRTESISGKIKKKKSFSQDEDEMDGMDFDIDGFDFKKSKKSRRKSEFSGASNSGFDELFAPADQFSEMLEQTGSMYGKVGSSSQVAVHDNASAKQLDWESKRNFRMHGAKRRKRW